MKRKIGETPNQKIRVSTYLDQDVADMIVKQAEDSDMSISEYLKFIVYKHLLRGE